MGDFKGRATLRDVWPSALTKFVFNQEASSEKIVAALAPQPKAVETTVPSVDPKKETSVVAIEPDPPAVEPSDAVVESNPVADSNADNSTGAERDSLYRTYVALILPSLLPVRI